MNKDFFYYLIAFFKKNVILYLQDKKINYNLKDLKMSILISALQIYVIIAVILFIFYFCSTFLFWEKTKKNISSDPIDVLITIIILSLFWILFLKSVIKGIKS